MDFVTFSEFSVGFVDSRVDFLGFLPGEDAGSDALTRKARTRIGLFHGV